MNWINQIIFWTPMVVAAIILLWLLYLEIKSEVLPKTAGWGLVIVIGVQLLQIVGQILYIYFSLRGDEFGQYLLPGKENSYFYQMIWNISQPFVWSLAAGVVIVLLVLILKKIMRSPMVDKADLLIIMITVFVVGTSSILVLIIGSFILMIFFMIGFGLRQKKINPRLRLKLAPFLLLAAFIILILNNFNFYWRFLNLLGIV